MIKTFFAQYEVYLWAAAAMILLIGGVVVVKHLEDIGENRQKAAQAALAEAQIVHKEEVEKRAQELNSANDATLHAALGGPPAKPTVAVRVCKPAANPQPGLPANGSAIVGSAGLGGLQSGVGSDGSSEGVDIAPDTETLLDRANAKLKYWQQYYATCKAEGACK